MPYMFTFVFSHEGGIGRFILSFTRSGTVEVCGIEYLFLGEGCGKGEWFGRVRWILLRWVSCVELG